MKRLLPILALALLAPVLWTEEPKELVDSGSSAAGQALHTRRSSRNLLAYAGTFSLPRRAIHCQLKWTFPLAMVAAFTSFRYIARPGR